MTGRQQCAAAGLQLSRHAERVQELLLLLLLAVLCECARDSKAGLAGEGLGFQNSSGGVPHPKHTPAMLPTTELYKYSWSSNTSCSQSHDEMAFHMCLLTCHASREGIMRYGNCTGSDRTCCSLNLQANRVNSAGQAS
jgi:hypothetical protein